MIFFLDQCLFVNILQIQHFYSSIIFCFRCLLIIPIWNIQDLDINHFERKPKSIMLCLNIIHSMLFPGYINHLCELKT